MPGPLGSSETGERSVLRNHRGRPVEFVVDANPHDIVGEMDTAGTIDAAARRRGKEGGIAEAQVQIFNLGGPVRSEGPLDSTAGAPSTHRSAIGAKEARSRR